MADALPLSKLQSAQEADELDRALALSRGEDPAHGGPSTSSHRGAALSDEPAEYASDASDADEENDPDSELSRALRESERLLRQSSLDMGHVPSSPEVDRTDLPDPGIHGGRVLPAGAAPLQEKDFLEEDRMLELAVRLSLEERELYEDRRRQEELAETTAIPPPPLPNRRRADSGGSKGRRRVPSLPRPVFWPGSPAGRPTSPGGKAEKFERRRSLEAAVAEPPSLGAVASHAEDGQAAASSHTADATPSTSGVDPDASPPRSPTTTQMEDQLRRANANANLNASASSAPRDTYFRKPLTPQTQTPTAPLSPSEEDGPSRIPLPPISTAYPARDADAPTSSPSGSPTKPTRRPPLPPKIKGQIPTVSVVPFPDAPSAYSPPIPEASEDSNGSAEGSAFRSARGDSAASSTSHSAADTATPAGDYDPIAEAARAWHLEAQNEADRVAAEREQSRPLALASGVSAPHSDPRMLDSASSSTGGDDGWSDSDTDDEADDRAVAGTNAVHLRPSLGIGTYDAQRSLSQITEQTEPAETPAPTPGLADDDRAIATIAGATTGLEETATPQAGVNGQEVPGIVRFRSQVSPVPTHDTGVMSDPPSPPETPRAERAEDPMASAAPVPASTSSGTNNAPRDSPGFGSAVRFGFPSSGDESGQLTPTSGGMRDVVFLSKERPSHEHGGIGPVWAVDAATWSLLLRFLMWYGETELRASPREEGDARSGRRAAALSVEFRKEGDGKSCVRLAVKLIDDELAGGYGSDGSGVGASSGGEGVASGGVPKVVTKRIPNKLRRKQKGKTKAVDREVFADAPPPPPPPEVTVTTVLLPDAVVLPTRLAQLAVTLFTLGHLAGIAVSTQSSKEATDSYKELRKLGGLIANLAATNRESAAAAAGAEGQGSGGAGDDKLIGRLKERLRRLRKGQSTSNGPNGAGPSTSSAQPVAGASVAAENSVGAPVMAGAGATTSTPGIGLGELGGPARPPLESTRRSYSRNNSTSAPSSVVSNTVRSTQSLDRGERVLMDSSDEEEEDPRSASWSLVDDEGQTAPNGVDVDGREERARAEEEQRRRQEQQQREFDEWDNEDRLRWLPNLRWA